jgi:hypothetical protein
MEVVKKIDFARGEDQEAMDFLTQKGLVDRILDDLAILGCVGENRNKFLTYLVATSRKMENPLACILRGDSSAGKSYLAETIIKLIPDEEKQILTRVTKQVLFYEEKLAHKLIYIKEANGDEDAIYAIRTLLSEKKLSLKRLVGTDVIDFEVEGPIAFIETTVDETIETQKATRVFEIWMDESIDHTQEIHKHQRQKYTLSGLELKQQSVETIERHHIAQKKLKGVHIAIPYVEQITFSSKQLRSRRDHQKFLDLICVSAFLHQFQRDCDLFDGQEYIKANMKDYEIASWLMEPILLKTLDDYGSKSRELLEGIIGMVRKLSKEEQKQLQEITFTRSEIAESMKWTLRQVRTHIKELEDLEAIKVISGSKGKEYQYRLLRDSDQMGPSGLLKPEELKRKYEALNSHVEHSE